MIESNVISLSDGTSIKGNDSFSLGDGLYLPNGAQIYLIQKVKNEKEDRRRKGGSIL